MIKNILLLLVGLSSIIGHSQPITFHPDYFKPAGGPCGETICNGQFAIFIDSGTPPYTIDISNGDSYTISHNYFLVDSLCAGSYTYTITDFLGQMANEAITIDPTVGVIAQVDTVIHAVCAGSFTGAIGIEVLTGQGPFTFSFDDGITFQNSNYQNNLFAGSYPVIVQDALGCLDTVNAFVNQPAPNSFSTIVTDIGCNGACTGSIEVTPNFGGGVAPYTFSKDNGLTFQTSNLFTGLCAGTYDIVMSDANGCLVNSNVIVDVSAALQVSANATSTPTCYGSSDGTVSATATGGTPPYSYTLNNGPSNGTGVFNNVAAGNHLISVVDANGCESSTTLTITELPDWVYNYILNISATCGNNDGEIEISAISPGTGPYLYSLDGGTTIQVNNGNFTDLYAGVYTLWVQDVQGCIDSTHFAISDAEVGTQEDAAIDPTCSSACDGIGIVSPTSGTAPFNYYLGNTGPSQPSGVFAGLCGGQYFVTIEDANACKGIQEVNLLEPDVIIFDLLGVDPLCGSSSDGSITAQNVTGGDGVYQYSIDGSTYQASSTFNGLTDGNYTIYVQDGNGCISTKDITLNAPTPLIVNINSTDVTCNGNSDGFVQVFASGGTPPYSYNVDGSTTTNGIYPGLSAGSYPTVVTDDNGCVSSPMNAVINEPAVITLSVNSSSDPICNGDFNGIVELNATGGTPLYLYSIDGGTTPFTTENFIYLNGGSYTFTVQDVWGCSATTNLSLTDPLTVIADTANTTSTFCAGICEGEVELTMSNGTGPYTINAPSGNITWVTLDNYTLDSICDGLWTIVVADNIGCMDSVDVEINTTSDIVIDTSNFSDPSCFGVCDGQVVVDLSNGTAPYNLTSDNGSVALISGSQYDVTDMCDGSAEIVATDDNGCIASVSLAVAAPSEILLSTSGQTDPLCFNDCNGEVTVDVTNGIAPYVLTSDNGNVALISGSQYDITDMCDGSAEIIATDDNGCIASVNLTLTAPSELQLNISNFIEPLCFGVCEGEFTVNLANGTSPYVLTTSSGNITNVGGNEYLVEDICAGWINVIVTDDNGCIKEGLVELTQPDSLYFTFTQSNIASCVTCNDGSGLISIVGGTFTYTIDWNGLTSETTTQADSLLGGTDLVCVTDANGCQFCDSVTVDFVDDSGIEEGAFEFSIYPNPADSYVVVVSSNIIEKLDILDLQGQLIFSDNYDNNSIKIDVSRLPSGIYFIKVYEGDQIIETKLVIQ